MIVAVTNSGRMSQIKQTKSHHIRYSTAASHEGHSQASSILNVKQEEDTTKLIADSRNFAIATKNGKVVCVRVMKTKSVNGGIAPLIFNLIYIEVRC